MCREHYRVSDNFPQASWIGPKENVAVGGRRPRPQNLGGNYNGICRHKNETLSVKFDYLPRCALIKGISAYPSLHLDNIKRKFPLMIEVACSLGGRERNGRGITLDLKRLTQFNTEKVETSTLNYCIWQIFLTKVCHLIPLTSCLTVSITVSQFYQKHPGSYQQGSSDVIKIHVA